MLTLSRGRKIVALFTAAYLAVAMVFLAVNWNPEFVYYGVALLGITLCVLWLDVRIGFPLWLLWGLSIWGLVHLAGGTIRIGAGWAEPGTSGTLYNLRVHPWAPKYDQVVHAYGFGLSTIAAWYALRSAAGVGRAGGAEGMDGARSAGRRPTLGLLAAIVLIGMGLGAMNEVIEFIATRIMPETNVGGYDNTGWDLISNLTGCVIGAAWVKLSCMTGRSY